MPRAADIGAIYHVYFPNVSAIHILLDYFIDQAEDRQSTAKINFGNLAGADPSFLGELLVELHPQALIAKTARCNAALVSS